MALAFTIVCGEKQHHVLPVTVSASPKYYIDNTEINNFAMTNDFTPVAFYAAVEDENCKMVIKYKWMTSYSGQNLGGGSIAGFYDGL